MEFIAELPYKSLRLSGCFQAVFCFIIIIEDRLRSDGSDSNKNVKKTIGLILGTVQ